MLWLSFNPTEFSCAHAGDANSEQLLGFHFIYLVTKQVTSIHQIKVTPSGDPKGSKSPLVRVTWK